MNYFIYDNKNSRDFNIIVSKITGYLSSPNRKTEIVEINGRNGSLIIDYESWKNKKIEIECYIESNNLIETALEIKKWLQSDFNYKILRLSTLNNFYFEASVINKLDISEVIEILGKFKIIFECKPLMKNINGNYPITITSETTIFNKYLESNPYFKIYGNGDVNININNQILILKDLEDYIEVDSEEMNCFKTENDIIILKNDKMYSSFPVLEPGENNISWLGNISKIEIIPRWNTI